MNSEHHSTHFGFVRHFPDAGKIVKRITGEQLTKLEGGIAKYLEALGYGA